MRFVGSASTAEEFSFETCGHVWNTFGISDEILRIFHRSFTCTCTSIHLMCVYSHGQNWGELSYWWIVIHPFIGIYLPIRRIPKPQGRWPYRRYHVLSMTDVIIWIDVYIIYNFIYIYTYTCIHIYIYIYIHILYIYTYYTYTSLGSAMST